MLTSGCNTGVSTDRDVVASSRADPNAFGELFARHSVVVQRYLLRRAGPDVAEEVLSETFLVAFQRRDRFDPDFESARPWLLGIATVLLRAHHRREARHLHTLARAAEQEDHDGGLARVADLADAITDVARLRQALAAMADGDRDVLLLYAWGELTYEQIATALSIPVGTVRSRLNRARSTLRRSTSLQHDQEDHHGRPGITAQA